jgi:RNA recognition motif-containing protein
MSTVRVFCGNLPDDVRKSEVEDLFSKYGRIRDIDIKLPRTGPGKCYATWYSWRSLGLLLALACLWRSSSQAW